MGTDQTAAEQLWNQLDFTEVQNAINQIFSSQSIDFQEMVQNIFTGKTVLSFQSFLHYFEQIAFSEFSVHKKGIMAICVVVICAAVFHAMGEVFETHQISDMSYYCMYLLLITLLLKTFYLTYQIADTTLTKLTEFMSALVPAYSISITMASGGSSATAFCGLILLIISITADLIKNLMLPMCLLYLILSLLNHFMGGDYLKSATDLVKMAVGFLSKSLIGMIVGINFIRSMTSPVIDTLKRGTLEKVIGSIPGIGNVADSVTQVVLGSAVLLKNGVGIAGAIVVLMICIIPILRLFVVFLMYKLLATVLGPAAHMNITNGISAAGDSTMLLIKTIVTAMLLFLITVAVVVATVGKV